MTREIRKDLLASRLTRLIRARGEDRLLILTMIDTLDNRHDLSVKLAREPGVGLILEQLLGRIFDAFGNLSDVKSKRILDLACGSNSSKAPGSFSISTPFRKRRIRVAHTEKFTAQFEPWFCRILLALGANPVGIDLGELDGELFEHYRIDLGQQGALNFLPDHSFDAIQDSRLFGSPEFTSMYPTEADRLRVAHEIRGQEKRLLRPDGVLIHSDADTISREK